jgi:hypothetical protein
MGLFRKIRDKVNNIRNNVADSKFAQSIGGTFKTARNIVTNPRDFFSGAGNDIRGFLTGDVRDKYDEIMKLQSSDPIDIVDPTAVIRDIEEKVTTRVVNSANDLNDQNQENIIDMLERIELDLLKELDEYSPTAADQIKQDFIVARGVLVTVIELIDTLINSPETVSAKEFKTMLINNTRALSSSSEYILAKIREQIPENSLLQDLFDLIEETNREQGLTKTKYVFMMGSTPNEEEETRSAYLEDLISEIESVKEELVDEKGKTPQDNGKINELEAELKTRLGVVTRLERPIALDLYTDIFNDVDEHYEKLVLAVLNDGESDLVPPPITTSESEEPRTRVLDFTFVQPEPELDDTKEGIIEKRMKKRLDKYAKIIQILDPKPSEKPKTREEVLMAKKLPEEQMIQRILNRTRLDEMLKKEFIDQENKRKGGIAFTSDTRDKLRISKIEEDLSDVDSEDRIMERLRVNTSTYLDLMNQYDEEAKKEAAKGKPINTNIERNQMGFIVSDEMEEESKLGIELVDKSLLRTTTVENLIDIDFKAIKLPVIQEDTVKRLESRIKQLVEELGDLESNNDNLLSSRTTQREKIKVKEDTIEQLKQQIIDVQDRLSVTPAEGQVFHIPIIESSAGSWDGNATAMKYRMDYWVIEDSMRRRFANYAMAQFYLDTRKKTLSSIKSIEPEVIRRIPVGDEISISELTNEKFATQALENNCYIPDQCLDGDAFRIYWGEAQEEIADDITIQNVISSMGVYASLGINMKSQWEKNGKRSTDGLPGGRYSKWKIYSFDGRLYADAPNLHNEDPNILSFNIWYSYDVGYRAQLCEQAIWRVTRLNNARLQAVYDTKQESKLISAEKVRLAAIEAERIRKERAELYKERYDAGHRRMGDASTAQSSDAEVNGLTAIELYGKARWWFAECLKIPTYTNDRNAKVYMNKARAQQKELRKIEKAKAAYNDLISNADRYFRKLDPKPEIETSGTGFGNNNARYNPTYRSFKSDLDKALTYYELASRLEGYMNTSYSRNQMDVLRSIKNEYRSIRLW